MLVKQPWMKFYPSDWRADAGVRVCSLAARGLWIEMLCIMHEADPRGSLVLSGKALTMAQLASLVGMPIKTVVSLFNELRDASVFSQDEDGTVYSRRIRRDIEKSEEDKANGKRGGNPRLKRGVNPPDKAHIPEARSQRPDTKSVPDFGATDADFDLFRSAYPKDIEPDGMRRELGARLEEGAAIADLVAGAKRYAAEVTGKEQQFIASPVRWLRDGRWKDGQGKPALTFPVIQRDSDAGRAWDAYQRSRGKPMLWHDGRATVRTEFPPAEDAA